MKDEASAIVIKAVATGAAAAFGLTWWAVAASFIGAVASYHFEGEQRPATVARLIFGICALAFTAALLASAMPNVPLMGWTENVLVEVRAGLLGLFASPLVKLGKRVIAGFKGPTGG